MTQTIHSKPTRTALVIGATGGFGGAVAEDLFDRGLCLPSGSNLTEGDLQRVVAVVVGCASFTARAI